MKKRGTSYSHEPQYNSFWPSDLSEWYCLCLAIAQNTTIRELFHSNSRRSSDGNSNDDKIFFAGLAANRHICKLSLDECNLDGSLITYMRIHLVENGRITQLHMNRCSIRGYRELREMLSCSLFYSLTLNRLYFDDLPTDDSTLSSIIETIVLSSTSNLTHFDISHNSALGSKTIASCAKMISVPNSNLMSITLSEDILNDDALHVISQSIYENRQSKLKYLNIVPAAQSRVTKVGWGALSRALCDHRDIGRTFDSNHTLSSLGCSWEHLSEAGAPTELKTYLGWNRLGVGMQTKIVQFHFTEIIDVDYFNEMPSALIPMVIAWLASHTSLTKCPVEALYNFLRAVPNAVKTSNRTHMVGLLI